MHTKDLLIRGINHMIACHFSTWFLAKIGNPLNNIDLQWEFQWPQALYEIFMKYYEHDLLK